MCSLSGARVQKGICQLKPILSRGIYHIFRG